MPFTSKAARSLAVFDQSMELQKSELREALGMMTLDQKAELSTRFLVDDLKRRVKSPAELYGPPSPEALRAVLKDFLLSIAVGEWLVRPTLEELASTTKGTSGD
jgi:hypothetical protein